MRFKLHIILISIIILFSCHSNSTLVRNMDEFSNAVTNAKPGETIILANGIWENAELLFDAMGAPDNPIKLCAQEKGKVFLEGKSNLRIAGENLIVEGLVFRNGNTPTSEVISFKKDNHNYANHCRVTKCVIDNFNNSERFESEYWIALYGKENRIDHCYFTGKRNQGVTLVVRLVDTLCQNNNHRIDHNYFGYRQTLGSNGGETMRIGTSHYSLTTSGTIVEENYFERCCGELEIISNKSCGNTFRNNTFLECKGTLTYRHGNDNIAEGNFFLGNNVEHTGGIRIINKRNHAINNYFYGLKGYRFRGALVIMNGVPDSPINRYHQVVDGKFTHNTFINCDHIQLCAGSDKERSAAPLNSEISNNIFYHDSKSDIFTIYDDISGISFSENYISENINSKNITGLIAEDIQLDKSDLNIYKPVNENLKNVGCSLEAPVANSTNTGVSWYPKKDEELRFDTGDQIHIKPGLNTLFDAIQKSKSGDVIILEPGAEYTTNKNISIHHPITVKTENDENKAILKTEKSSLFTIENEGSLKLESVKIDGSLSPDLAGNSIISTSQYSMNRNYKVIVNNCDIIDLDVNNSFDFVKIYKNTFADSIAVTNCTFKNITGNILALDKETEELGKYNAEHVILYNCSFADVQGAALNVLRGGTDESTFGPNIKIDHCVFNQVGKGKRNKIDACVYLHGSQITNITNCIFYNSANTNLYLTNGEPVTNILHCNFYQSGKIESNNNIYNKKEITYFNPLFIDNYQLSSASKLKNKAIDGKNLGILE